MDYSNFPKNDVLCIDIRSFYASVEAVKRGLDPMKVKLAVVGDTTREGSVVLAMTPMLKQTYQLPNVCRFFQIPKHDPNIILAPAAMQDYIKVSVEITKLLYEFVPKEAIHPYSIDEVWITVNGLYHLYGSPIQIAKKIKQAIYNRFGLTSSIGIGDNKFLAKVVMDLYAKKTGIAECRYEDVKDKLWPIAVEHVWGIGPGLQKRLYRLGITHIKDLALTKKETLIKHFGIIGEQLYWHAWGVDLSPVFGNFLKQEQKGFGHGITLLRDYQAEEMDACILDLCDDVCFRARKANLSGKTVQLHIGYTKTAGISKQFHRSTSLATPTNQPIEMHRACMHLFHKFHQKNQSIRRVSVSLTNLVDADHLQLDLFAERNTNDALYQAIDFITEKYGPTAILRGSSLTSGGVRRERHQKIGGHFK